MTVLAAMQKLCRKYALQASVSKRAPQRTCTRRAAFRSSVQPTFEDAAWGKHGRAFGPFPKNSGHEPPVTPLPAVRQYAPPVFCQSRGTFFLPLETDHKKAGQYPYLSIVLNGVTGIVHPYETDDPPLFHKRNGYQPLNVLTGQHFPL